MKKFVAGLVAGSMILSLVACLPTGVTNTGDKDSNDAVATIVSDSNSGSDNAGTVNNNGNDDLNNPVNPDDNTDTDNTDIQKEYTSYPIYSVYDYNVQYKYKIEGDYSSPKVIDTLYSNISVNSSEYNDYQYKELSEKFQEVNKSNEDNLTEIYEGFESDYNEEFADADLDWGPVLYEYDHKGVIRADKKIFSTGNNAEVYYGGAHGGAYEGGFAYNSQTGEAINFNDVVIKTDGLADIITDELYENYDKEIFFAETKEDLKEEVQTYVDYLTDNSNSNWSVNYDGVAIYFGDYALAAYASGHQIVFINYDEYPEYLNSEYFKDADEEYVMHVSKCVSYPMYLGDKEYALSFSWEKEWNEEGQFYSDTYTHLYVYGAPDYYQDIRIDGSFMDPTIYIIRKNGKDYLYVQNYFFDGVEYLQIFEFNGKEFEEVAAYQGGIAFESNELTDEVPFWATSSFADNFEFPSMQVKIGDDGLLVFGEYFDYDLYDDWEKYYAYKPLSDLKAYEVDDEYKPTDVEKTLKKGTIVRPIRSDLDTFITVTDTDGELYGFKATYNTGDMMINNKRTGELFDAYSEW